MTLDEQIDEEFKMYLDYCRLACNHDEDEQRYRSLAHKIFYRIQELRSTGKILVEE